MTIIIDRIMTPYEIARYNEINKVLKGNLEIWFLTDTEENRHWNKFPPAHFQFKTLQHDVAHLLHEQKKNVRRVVCCGWDDWNYWKALWFCKRYHIRFTLWSGNTVNEYSIKRLVSYPLVRLFVKLCDDFIAYGTRAKEYLMKLGVREKNIRIFLNSVDSDYFRRNAQILKNRKMNLRTSYQIPAQNTVFVFVGQLIDRKGIRELLEAFLLVSKKEKNVTLFIAGEGPLRDEVTQFKNEHKHLSIVFIGYVQYNELPKIYAVSDALILPSKEEVWGLVVNEGLASNLPVLVSKYAGSVADLINKENGEVIADISPGGIAECMERFLKKRTYTISKEILDRMSNETYAKEVFTTK